jgi:hypothetical protein
MFMGKQKKKKNYLSMILPIVISAGVGALIGILSKTVFNDYFNTYIDNGSQSEGMIKVLGMIIIFFAGYLIHIIIHEAGHLIFGLLTGYSYVSFRIASHTLIMEEGKLKYKRFNIPGTAGQCLMMPPELKDGKYPFVIYNYGGVLMNLIVAAIEILAAVFIPAVTYPIDAILVLTAFGGILAALTNGIPMKLSGVPNDAYNVFSMVRDEEAKRGFYIQLKVNGLLTLGERLKDIPYETFKLKGNTDITNPLNTSVRLLEYGWHLDNMDFESAKQTLDSFLPDIDKIPMLFRNEINCERIFFELIGSCDKEFIDELYDKKLKNYVKASKFLIGKKRFLMAYEGFYNKNLGKAMEHYKSAKSLAKKYPIKGDAESELMIMEWIEQKLK